MTLLAFAIGVSVGVVIGVMLLALFIGGARGDPYE